VLTIVIPTRDRPSQLARTLREIEQLGSAAFDPLGGAEVIIADNRSKFPVTAPVKLDGTIPVRVLHRRTNEAAAARNACAREASSQGKSDWLLMLDDDSAPLDAAFVSELLAAPDEVSAICADIRLEDGRRESGGLPEVPIGCGVAVRTSVFNSLGGYDPSFHYYAEEYDLAAKMILAGLRIEFSAAFRVLHRKDSSGRNMDAILRSLVRNNAWLAQRYAPDGVLEWVLDETVERYRLIAEREGAMSGYATGLAELRETLDTQVRTPMNQEQYDRFTGLSAAREHLARVLAEAEGPIWVGLPDGAAPGKNAWAIRQALRELNFSETDDPSAARIWVPATLSPGPMLDAAKRFVTLAAARVELAWDARSSLTLPEARQR
jgi:GT2 family glycosyltransferase